MKRGGLRPGERGLSGLRVEPVVIPPAGLLDEIPDPGGYVVAPGRGNALLLAVGRTRILANTRVIQLGVFIPTTVALVMRYGILGAVVAIDLAALVGLVILLLQATGIHSEIQYSFPTDVPAAACLTWGLLFVMRYLRQRQMMQLLLTCLKLLPFS